MKIDKNDVKCIKSAEKDLIFHWRKSPGLLVKTKNIKKILKRDLL